MESETQSCKNCKKDFTIEPEDFKYYEKIKVPPPTWCPECRLRRRLVFLNHRSLYRRSCDMCAKSMISMYDVGTSFSVYCPDCYWSDKWDAREYGQEYDFSIPFFEQYEKLEKRIPHLSLMGLHSTWVNSDYNNYAGYLRNCYLLFNSDYSENCIYGSEVESSKECVDNIMIDSCELCYEGTNLIRCYGTRFSRDCEDCQNVWFSKNCANCSDCVGCINLRNKKFNIFNVQYSKEAYLQKMKEFKLNFHEGVLALKAETEKFFEKFPQKFIHGRKNDNVSGAYINQSKNVRDTYIALGARDCRYCMWLIVAPNKDCYDYTQFGDNAELIYESLVCGGGVSNIKFSRSCVDTCSDIQYSFNCYSASHMFGCSNIQRGNSYCILNKQYSKDEYENLLPKVIEHMRSTKEYGQFFPEKLSPFAYNETMAQEHFPLTKEEAIAVNYQWKEGPERNYKIEVQAEDIPGTAEKLENSIVNKVIECAHKGKCNEQCTEAFKIIENEIRFYKKMNLPPPRLCPNCRHYQRSKYRNPIKLWHRQCMCNQQGHIHEGNCQNNFETTYAPNIAEAIYCETCYQAEFL